MMSGIFVDSNDKVDITIFYKIDGKNVVIVDKADDGCKSLKVTFKFPDFSTSQKLMQDSMTMSENGPMVDLLKIRYNMLRLLVVGWDAKDEKGGDIKLTMDAIGKLHPVMATAIINKSQELIDYSSFLSV
jgi:hypoxanthine phosphoribosyltransferase